MVRRHRSDGRETSHRLVVEFCGEECSLEPGHALSFGRDADLSIDENPYLHRVLGRFVHRGGHWWLDNVGRSIGITVVDQVGASTATIGPGSSTALVHGSFRASFVAGPTRYELEGTLEDVELERDLLGSHQDGQETLEWGQIELNPDQRLLLTVLCEARLNDPTDRFAPIAPNRASAARLGWSVAKFNRKLDNLCLKLSRHGVAGVHGDLAQLAANRRRVVVDHAVERGLVTAADLQLIRRAA